MSKMPRNTIKASLWIFDPTEGPDPQVEAMESGLVVQRTDVDRVLISARGKVNRYEPGDSVWLELEDAQAWLLISKLALTLGEAMNTAHSTRVEDALVWKNRLLDFTLSDQGALYTELFQTSMNAQHVPEERMSPGVIRALQLKCLRDADPIYVSAEMTELVDIARQDFKPEKLLPGDPWTPAGFALFPKPILLDDAPLTENTPGRAPTGLIPVRALSWYAVHNDDLTAGCFWISFYQHVDDDSTYAGHDPVMRENILAPMMLGHTWQWSWGSDPTLPESQPNRVEGEDPEESRLRAVEQAAFVQSFWRLGQQFVPTKERAPRPLRREAKRKNRPEQSISVMRLRRKSPGHVDGETGVLTVQFPVNGHWRNHWFPKLREHRQIWISPYIKGPEGAPFKAPRIRGWEFSR